MPALSAERFATHDRADFAQEFLRRNTAYKAAWERRHGDDRSPDALAEAGQWGLVRLFDPDALVRRSPALWHAGAASQLVTMVRWPTGFEGGAPLPVTRFMACFEASGWRYRVADHDGIRHRFALASADADARLAILLPPLGDTLRALACDAARRMIAGLSVTEVAGTLRPSIVQRRRLILLLRVLDASHFGASNREIGTAIVYPWLADISASAWKASSERRRVQRLVSEAHALAAGGYRTLLRA